MTDAWQILRDGGLPLAEPQSGKRRSPAELAHAAQRAIAMRPRGRDADALAAWLVAWHAHWPSSFARELGPDAAGVLSWARSQISDDNRYLKLRRLALANLAEVL